MHTLMKDLTVELGPDRPGTLARALDAIGKAGINLEGYAQAGATLHVLAADAAATRRALESAGFRNAREEDVVVVNVSDRPGAGASILRPIGEGNVNVTFSYVATGTRIVIGASNVAKVTEILNKQAATIG